MKVVKRSDTERFQKLIWPEVQALNFGIERKRLAPTLFPVCFEQTPKSLNTLVAGKISQKCLGLKECDRMSNLRPVQLAVFSIVEIPLHQGCAPCSVPPAKA